MKLRNKKTGEIVEDAYVRETHDFQFDGQKHILAVFKGNGHRPPERISGPYNSLAELNEEWEDAPEEPEEFWYINECGDVLKYKYDGGCSCPILEAEEIGNRFETEEEAEKAVEKLKAWKRLKDKGFRFSGYTDDSGDLFSCQVIRCRFNDFGEESEKDLDLLFGGEE